MVAEPNVPVPMALGIFIQRGEHDGQNDVDVVADEVAEVLVIPEVEGAFRHLR